MEKQILQTREYLKKNDFKFPEKPITISLKDLKKLKSSLNGLPINIKEDGVNKTTKYLLNLLYQSIIVINKVGLADRIIPLFDVLHSSMMHDTEPSYAPILERNFKAYENLRELLEQQQAQENKDWSKRLNKFIKSKLDDQDLEDFNQLMNLEKKLEKKISVEQSNDVNGRSAKVIINKIEYTL